jgi:inner membrane protein
MGAALAEAGLKRRTSLGSAALLIASNLPDVDVLVFATDVPAIGFRRGWTHGIGAQLLLPPLLAGALYLIGRRRAHAAEPSATPPLDAVWLLGLSYIGTIVHVGLDFLNNYGVRLLAPFSWRWFYGDALFIVDPWLWLLLGAGVWLSRRRGSRTPARRVLVASASYIALMLVSVPVARRLVADQWRADTGVEPRALMVGPAPVDPFTRVVIVDAGDRYRTGVFSWWTRTAVFDPSVIPKNDRHPTVALARDRSPDVRAFLVWSRFPFWVIADEGRRPRVTVGDVRFASGAARFTATARVE